MKFPNFNMNKSFTARALVIITGLLIVASTAFSQRLATSQKGDFAPLANIGLNIEQCANGPLAAPIHCDTAQANEGYGRGNLVSSKSHYFEGDSVPIRVLADGLTAGTTGLSITIGYDYTKGGKYATDYLTDYDRTESVNNNPCVDVPGCTLASETTFAIPTDPTVTAGFNGVDDGVPGPTGGDDILQIPGSFSCFGCTITGVSAYSFTGATTGDSSKFLTITFTANQENIVIAYGSHISTRSDWGLANSAINISGSPYHNFISAQTIGANSGNRDLQLSAEAVIFPGVIRIKKAIFGTNFQTSSTFVFGFTSSQPDFGGSNSFTAVDDFAEVFNPVDPQGGTPAVSDNIMLFGAGNPITITENQYPNVWTLSRIDCTSSVGAGIQVTPSVLNRNVTIILQEGEFLTCQFTNTQAGPTAAPASITGRVSDATGMGLRGVSVTLVDVTTGEVRSAITNTFGYYTFRDMTVNDFYRMSVSSKRYVFDTPVRSFTLTEDLAGMDFVSVE